MREQLWEGESQLATIASLSMEAIQCRHPSKSYAIFLKEKWFQFQIKTLAQYVSLPFQHYKRFIKFFQQARIEDRAKFDKFYMHNMILTNMNFWDPNLRLGDEKLMVLASWLTHKETRVKELNKVITKEASEPLYIRLELVIPKAIISNHNIISADPKLSPRYLETKEQVILHF